MLTISPINFARKANSKSVTNYQPNQSSTMHSQPMQDEVSFKAEVIHIRHPKKVLSHYSKDNPLFQETFRLFEKVRKEVFEPGMELLNAPKFERGEGAIVPYKDADSYGIQVGNDYEDISLARHQGDPSSYTFIVWNKIIGGEEYTFDKNGLSAPRHQEPLTGDWIKDRSNIEQQDIDLNRKLSDSLQAILDVAQEKEEKGLAAIHEECNFSLINGI